MAKGKSKKQKNKNPAKKKGNKNVPNTEAGSKKGKKK